LCLSLFWQHNLDIQAIEATYPWQSSS
jgi:hypothetical protein